MSAVEHTFTQEAVAELLRKAFDHEEQQLRRHTAEIADARVQLEQINAHFDEFAAAVKAEQHQLQSDIQQLIQEAI